MRERQKSGLGFFNKLFKTGKGKKEKEASATGSFSGSTAGGGKVGKPEKSGNFIVYKWDIS